MDAWLLELLLYLFAMLLFFIEIFIPSGGALAAGALICFGYSLYSLFSRGQSYVAWIEIIVTIVYLGFLVRLWLKRMRMTETLATSSATGEDVTRAASLIGAVGVTVTPLRPAGIAKIDGDRYDVMTNGGFLEKGTEITVVEASGNRILVRRHGA